MKKTVEAPQKSSSVTVSKNVQLTMSQKGLDYDMTYDELLRFAFKKLGWKIKNE